MLGFIIIFITGFIVIGGGLSILKEYYDEIKNYYELKKFNKKYKRIKK